MAALTHLDTHVALWAVNPDEHDRLSNVATTALESDTLRVSPMVRLELAYLHETGRITAAPGAVLQRARRVFGVADAEDAFGDVIEQAQAMTWTRDPFDRIIAAHAVAAGARLLTRDETIRDNLDIAVW